MPPARNLAARLGAAKIKPPREIGVRGTPVNRQAVFSYWLAAPHLFISRPTRES